MEIVATTNAPKPVGHYSQGIIHGGLVYVSGQLAIDAASGDAVNGSIEEQTALTLKNLAAVLEAAGSSVDRVLKVTVYIADLALFPRMNAAYGEFFGTHRPARATAPVTALPKGLLVEIDAVAAVE